MKNHRPELKLTSQRMYASKNDKSERVKQYEILLDKVSKYLNFLQKILQSKIVMAEIFENDELVFLLIRLLISRNSTISL